MTTPVLTKPIKARIVAEFLRRLNAYDDVVVIEPATPAELAASMIAQAMRDNKYAALIEVGNDEREGEDALSRGMSCDSWSFDIDVAVQIPEAPPLWGVEVGGEGLYALAATLVHAAIQGTYTGEETFRENGAGESLAQQSGCTGGGIVYYDAQTNTVSTVSGVRIMYRTAMGDYGKAV